MVSLQKGFENLTLRMFDDVHMMFILLLWCSYNSSFAPDRRQATRRIIESSSSSNSSKDSQSDEEMPEAKSLPNSEAEKGSTAKRNYKFRGRKNNDVIKTSRKAVPAKLKRKDVFANSDLFDAEDSAEDKPAVDTSIPVVPVAVKDDVVVVMPSEEPVRGVLFMSPLRLLYYQNIIEYIIESSSIIIE